MVVAFFLLFFYPFRCLFVFSPGVLHVWKSWSPGYLRKKEKYVTKKTEKNTKKRQPHVNVYWICFFFCCFLHFLSKPSFSFCGFVCFCISSNGGFAIFHTSFRFFCILKSRLKAPHKLSWPKARLQIAAQAMPHQDGARPFLRLTVSRTEL